MFVASGLCEAKDGNGKVYRVHPTSGWIISLNTSVFDGGLLFCIIFLCRMSC